MGQSVNVNGNAFLKSLTAYSRGFHEFTHELYFVIKNR